MASLHTIPPTIHCLIGLLTFWTQLLKRSPTVRYGLWPCPTVDWNFDPFKQWPNQPLNNSFLLLLLVASTALQIKLKTSLIMPKQPWMGPHCRLQQCGINTEPLHCCSTPFAMGRSTFLVASKGPFQVVIRAPLIVALCLHMLLIRTSQIASKRAVYKAFSWQ